MLLLKIHLQKSTVCCFKHGLFHVVHSQKSTERHSTDKDIPLKEESHVRTPLPTTKPSIKATGTSLFQQPEVCFSPSPSTTKSPKPPHIMSSFTTQIIIDNITTTQTTADLIEQTKSIFTDKIKDIKQLQKGGLIITPSHAEHIHDLTDITHYPTASYGRNLYIHKTNNDNNQLPWLCINQIPYEQDKDEQKLEDIRNKLNETTDGTGGKIGIIGLHRKYRGQLPTTLLLYKTETATAQDYLLNNDIRHNQHKLKTRLYIHKTQIQCTNCNKLGHTKNKCKNNYRCVRCGEKCPPNNCKNQNFQNPVNGSRKFRTYTRTFRTLMIIGEYLQSPTSQFGPERTHFLGLLHPFHRWPNP